jgi:hypothetical protein
MKSFQEQNVHNQVSLSLQSGLTQLIRFLVLELTHPGLNPIFDMNIVFMANYSFSGRRRPRQQRCALSDRLYQSQDQTDSIFRMCS